MKPKPGFAAARFFCRFLPEQPRDVGVLIEEPFWGEDDPPLRFQNIADAIRDDVEQQIDLGDAPFASWLLARLWFLSQGTVLFGLNTDASGSGTADGGHYLIFAVLEDPSENAVAELEIEGMNFFAQMILTARSVHISANEAIGALTETLKSHPFGISTCRIAIADPEQHGRIHEYGWDGQRFLGVDTL